MTGQDRLFSLSPGFYQALEDGTRSRSWLGISLKESASGAGGGRPALEVVTLFPQSPAQEAGLLPGDRIVGFQGQALQAGEVGSVTLEFLKQVAQTGVGQAVNLKVLRGEREFTVQARLGERPAVIRPLKSSVRQHTPLQAEPPSLLTHLLGSSGKTTAFEASLRAMGQRADEVVSTAVKGDAYNPFQLNTVNSLLHRPLALPGEGRDRTDRLNAGFEGDTILLDQFITTGAEGLDLELSSRKQEQAPVNSWTAYLDALINKIVDLQNRHRAVIAMLSPDEIERVEHWFRSWMRGLGKPTVDLSPEQKKKAEAMTLDVLNTALRLNLKALLEMAHELAQTIDIVHLQTLSRTADRHVNIPQGWVARQEGDRTVFQTPAGRVVVGGMGPDEYTDEAVLILDFGGNDTYRNRPGGARPGFPFSVVVDLEGDDRYESDQPFAQGAAFLGVGFLIDLEGDDVYNGGVLSQGTGIFGAGVLLDVEGRDRYLCRAFCQASAGWGLGFLLEGGGHDHFQADLYAQGLGFVKGYAALVDRTGNDHYFAGGLEKDHREPGKATLSMAQGFGLGLRPWESVAGASGGIGILSDLKGNDTYSADYFAQGASYWLALGILHDGEGHDRYLAGRYSQGAGIHYSAGLLQDDQGDDQYITHFGVSQGCGHDFGIGWLADAVGDDLYVSGVMAQGAGNANGLGVLQDDGGRDRYFVESEGQGRGPHEPMRELGSFGFLVDSGEERIITFPMQTMAVCYKRAVTGFSPMSIRSLKI